MSDSELIKPGSVTLPELRRRVGEQVGTPVSSWAVAATLESFGLRDVDVREQFEHDSVFELAEQIYEELIGEAEESGEATGRPADKIQAVTLMESARLFGKHYSLGLLFSLPMMSQIAAVVIFRYSLWAWLEFNEAQATMVAFGTIISFVITGGFVQTLGRYVSRYKGEGNFRLAYVITRKVIYKGVLSIALVMAAIFLLNIVIPFYPMGMTLLALSYVGFISLLLLASAVLYALEQRVVILLSILAGTGVVIAGMDLFEIGIYFSQWIGMTVAILLQWGYGYLYFRIKTRISGQDKREGKLQEPEVRYYNSYRYFVYGFCYFLFLFLDRLLAWSAGPPPPPYVIWFNTPYELGMDWALISLVLTIGVLEYSIQSFSRQMLPAQKQAPFREVGLFNKYFKKFYFKQIILLLVIGIGSIIVTYISVESLKAFQNEIPEIRDFFANPMTTWVFWIAGISYLFLVFGLLNSLFFLTLNRPSFVMYAMIAATVVNFSVGYVASRVISLEYAVVGLMAGSITFAGITMVMAWRFFKRLDYYYYSAF